MLVADGIAELVWLLELDHRALKRKQVIALEVLLAKDLTDTVVAESFPTERATGASQEPSRQERKSTKSILNASDVEVTLSRRILHIVASRTNADFRRTPA